MSLAKITCDRVAGTVGRWAYLQCLAARNNPAPYGTAWWKLCNRIRQRIIQWCDPVISMDIGGVSLRMPLSHQLPTFWWRHPLYDRALPRIAKHVSDACGKVRVIDVGANIGDTAAALLLNPAASCLCIEGDTRNMPMLGFNLSRFGDRGRAVHACCDEHRGGTCKAPIREGGTTRFSDSGGMPPGITALPLDDIAAENDYLNCNLLKVDTDGFDFKVLRGAEGLLRSARPAIFFEWQPEFLEMQHEDPLSIFPWLAERGYDELLLYGNLGHAIAIYRTGDEAGLRTALNRIDGRTIHYYDVLTVHRNTSGPLRDLLTMEHDAAARGVETSSMARYG